MNDLEAAKLLVEEMSDNEAELSTIKVYEDKFCNEKHALVGFKGKTPNVQGVIFCPYIDSAFAYKDVNSWYKDYIAKRCKEIRNVERRHE